MSLSFYLTNCCIGALVGAGTNDIAVRMIFRYLIPRKKGQIADAIRDVVATELLTPAKIVAKLEDEDVRTALRDGVDGWLGGFLARDLPSWIELTEARRDTLGPREEALFAELMDHLFLRLASDDFRNHTLRPALAGAWASRRNHSPATDFPRLEGILREGLTPRLEEWLASEAFSGQMASRLAAWTQSALRRAHTLSDLIPEGLREELTAWLAERSGLVLNLLAAALEEPAMQARLAGMIEDALRRNAQAAGKGDLLSRVKAFATEQFADVRGAVEQLPNAVRAADPGEIAPLLHEAIENLWRRPWREVIGDPADGAVRAWVEKSLRHLWTRDAIRSVTGALADIAVRSAHRPWGELAEAVLPADGVERGLDRAAVAWQTLLGVPETREFAETRFSAMLAVAKAMPIGRLQQRVDASVKDEAVAFVADAVTLVLRERLADFADRSGVWNIVRDSINQYDDRQLERLVRRIANRELQAVTWLGGVIGAAVGLVQSLLLQLWG